MFLQLRVFQHILQLYSLKNDSNEGKLNDTNFGRSRTQFHHVGAQAKTARQTAQVPSPNQHSYCITNSAWGKCLLCLKDMAMLFILLA